MTISLMVHRVDCDSRSAIRTIAHASYPSSFALLQVLGSIDAGQAVVTFYMIAGLMTGTTDIRIFLAVDAILVGIFVLSWRKTAKLAVILTAFVVPHAMC